MSARVLALLAGLALAALVLAPAGRAALQDDDDAPLRFESVVVEVDAGARALAAWQIELRDPSGRASVVGVEGLGAFTDPTPAYDPAALHDAEDGAGERIVLAAFTLADDPPTGRAPVARLHLAVRGEGPVTWAVRLDAAADPNGDPIDASAEALAGE